MLDYSVIAISNWAVSNRFYREVVGADVIEIGQSRWAYRLSGALLKLNVHGPSVDAGDNVARIPVRPGNSDLCFVSPGAIEDAVAHLEHNRVEVEPGPIARFGARGEGTSVYCRDPEGRLLEFISYEPDPAANREAAETPTAIRPKR